MLNQAIAHSTQRVMFYLPVVTPWWFENIVVHLIRVMAREHEVHVLIPPLWRNTGLSPDQLHLIDDLDHVQWHLLDGEDHPILREDASGEDDLIEFVETIAPDLTLCRSADIVAPARFPGTVRHIMEGAAPPIPTDPAWVILSETLFDYGVLPELPEPENARLDALATTLAPSLIGDGVPDRQRLREDHGLDQAARIIGLPLEYEHEENFFGRHHTYPDNAVMITELARALPEGTLLAVTNHPLNELYGDNRAIMEAIAVQDGKVVMLSSDSSPGQATLALAKHCDGMIVGNSKSWAACAAFGTPLFRLSDFETGAWANAYRDLESFLGDIAAGTARTPDPIMARRWYAHHLLDRVFDPADPALRASDIAARASRPVDPARWVSALARFHAQPSSIAA